MLFSTITLSLMLLLTLKTSLHFLNFLLLVELVIISLIILLFPSTLNWFILYFFLIIAVCMSCYGVSLLVNNTQNKGNTQFLLF